MKSNFFKEREGLYVRREDTGHDSLCWVCDLADALIREIAQEAADLPLYRQPEGPPLSEEHSLVSIYSKVDGAYFTELVFRGELSLFFQVASNMQGVPSPSMEDAVDYALELFNMFCGRFISEVYRATGIPARFYPPRYLGGQPCSVKGAVKSLYYLSQHGEQAQFSWTADSVEQLLIRRTANNDA